ncbi:unnamed protein product [Caenorhabditis nigoni]
MNRVRVRNLVENWQNSKPEIGRHYSLEVYNRIDTAIRYFTSDQHPPEVQRNLNLAPGTFEYSLTFPINREKVLNVLLEKITNEIGMDKYVMHFKIDPKS